MVNCMVENATHCRENQPLSNDVLFDLLSEERRRFALYCLERYQIPMALADLADEVALLESDADTLLNVPAEEIKETYLDLYHCHIPKFQEANLLTYSQAEDAVYLKSDLSDLNLEQFLETTHSGCVA